MKELVYSPPQRDDEMLNPTRVRRPSTLGRRAKLAEKLLRQVSAECTEKPHCNDRYSYINIVKLLSLEGTYCELCLLCEGKLFAPAKINSHMSLPLEKPSQTVTHQDC